MATIKNDKYQVYALYEAKVVPLDELKVLVTLFIDYAALNLGAKVLKADVDRIIEFIQEEFSYLPIYAIAGAFIRGSLGKLKNDKTTLNPRNIHDWLSEVSQDFRNRQDHNKRELELAVDYVPFNLQQFPLGKAICWKIDHVGQLNWDNIPLRVVAEMIGRHEIPTLRDFGIEHKTGK